MKSTASAVLVGALTVGSPLLYAQEETPPTAVAVKEAGQNTVAQKITTFLMFEGKAEEAIKFYVSLFKDSKIVKLTKYGKEGPGPEGSVLHATFTLNGQQFMAIDSPAKHGFTFTPAVSLYVTCDSKAEIDELFKKLSEGGKVMMPLDKYPFAERFGWVADKYGVSWQLSLSKL